MDPEKKIDLLLKEYDNRFTEIMFHSQRYHKQVNYLQVYLSIIVTTASFVFSNQNLSKTLSKFNWKNLSSEVLFLILLSLGVIVSFYLFSNVMDSAFMLRLNGSRLSAIEQIVNKEAKCSLLIWDSQIIPNLLSKGFLEGLKNKLWVKPNYLVALWIFLVYLMITITLSGLSYFVARTYCKGFIIVTILGACFHIYQWYILFTSGMKYLDTRIEAYSGITNPAAASTKNSKFSKGGAAAFLLTVFLGFVPLILLSIKLNAFWISSSYHFPLVTNTSVWFGDLVILPFINYRLYKLFRFYIYGLVFNKYKISSIIWAVFSLVLSIGINTYNHHYLWIHDKYTGFMDVVLGQLSVAGWWHYCFSVIQMALIFIFIWGWIISVKEKITEGYYYAHGTWKLFILFSLLSVSDFLIRHFWVFKTPSLGLALKTDWMSLLIFPLTLAVLVTMSLKRKSLNDKITDSNDSQGFLAG